LTETKERQENKGQEVPTNQATGVFPIAGIGASAGGLDAIRKLLENTPQNTGIAFVIIQHLASNQESMLSEILARFTQMPVNKIEGGMAIEPNHVYVIPAGKIITIKKGILRLQPKGIYLKPIDAFLFSLALDQKTYSIGIVLSGTGNDGTEGLKAIRREGGITFAQEPKTAQYADMPLSAISSDAVDFVLSPEQVGEELCGISKQPDITRQKIEAEEAKPQETNNDLQTIFSLLKGSFGVNFANYKKTMINRRVSRRMILNSIETLSKYVEYLQKHFAEQQALFDDMLLNVTEFFREPNTFLTLKEKVFSELVEKKTPNQVIKVWIPGCSTGEEVYSVAIALTEFLEQKGLNFQILIFGTDVNAKNIMKARRGTYLKTKAKNVSEDQLNRFFSLNGIVQVTEQIRDKCVFARHDIMQGPLFCNMDLVICRNLLIYLEPSAQESVLGTINHSLKTDGYLVLGESESVGKFSNVFETLTKKGVIFRKKINHR
jgi:two-component system CheB/CheR fusion protein